MVPRLVYLYTIVLGFSVTSRKRYEFVSVCAQVRVIAKNNGTFFIDF